MAEEGKDDGRINKGIAHHEFPIEISASRTPEGIKARQLLIDIGFNLESTGNKTILFANNETAEKISSSTFKQAWLDAGGGMNVQDPYKGSHPGFNQFVIDALAALSDRAIDQGWTDETKKLAVFDLWGFVHENSRSGAIPLQNIPAAIYDAAWHNYQSFDYREIDSQKLSKINSDIYNFRTDVIDTKIDPYNPSAETKYEFNRKLLSNLQGQLTPEQYANAIDLFNKSNGGAKAGHNNASIISLVYDIKVQAGIPDTNLTSITEYASTKTYDFYKSKDGTWTIEKSTSLYEQLFETFKAVSDKIPETLADYGKNFLTEFTRGAKNALVETGKLSPALIVPFLNATYDSLKKGFATNDWTDFSNTATKFGTDVLLGGLVMITSVAAAAAIPTVGTVLATIVATGWASFGLYTLARDGYELIEKISTDVGKLIGDVKDKISQIHAGFEEIEAIGELIGSAKRNDFEAPNFITQDRLLNIYLIDSQNVNRPDAIDGTAAREQFYGKNGAKIYAGMGNDEITIKDGYGEAHGEGGDDVLTAGNSRVVAAGQPLNPTISNGPVAQKALFQLLDGGEGKDIVIAVGGEKAVLDGGLGNDSVIAVGDGKAITTAGGLGRDWIYNRSNGGIIYGDTPAGTYEKPVLDAQGNPVLNSDGAPKTSPTKVEDSKENADNIWYSANTVVKDAQHHDFLKFYGLTLTGGNAEGGIAGLLGGGGVGAAAGLANFYASLDETGKYDPARTVYFDHLFPWMTYMFRPNGNGGLDMYVTNQFDQLFTAVFGGNASDAYKQRQALDAQGILKGWMKVENFDLVGSFIGYQQASLAGEGSFGMVFKAPNPIADLMTLLQPLLGVYGIALAAQHGGNVLIDQAITLSAAATRFAKGLKWADGADPLVIDLDGDGIETTEIATSQVYFDVDGDLFAERTGWLDGDDGFLVRDLNGNGRIDDVSEMFGGVGRSGFAQLAGLDSDGDGRITRADLLWAELKVWQDRDRDGVTDSGELKSLDQLGIVSLDLGSTGIDIHTPQGARLTGFGDVAFEGGAVRRMYDAILASNDTDTRFAGEAGHAVWQPAGTLDLKGFGRIADLSVATANDIGFSALVGSTAAAMTTATLRALVAQVGDVLGAWGEALEETRELAPVLVGMDANGKPALLDRGIYVEDAAGGYWTLASGAPVRDAQGNAVSRATLQDVLAQAAAAGAGWRLEQTWSPSTRAEALHDREAAPYLTRVENGRAVVLDYGIRQADGGWALASDPATHYATKAEILALGHAAGTEWRAEALGFNPYVNLPVERIGVRFTDGIAVDYTVAVADRDGTFYVWARNLDRALQLEWKTGDSREFNLRNYAIDFGTLDEVSSTDDSTYRVEMLTPAQFHFATSLGGIDFRPEMLSARLDNATGHIAYSVGPGGGANLSSDPATYVSGIATMIDMLQPVMEQYIATSRRYAVRLAAQGGLKDFFDGVAYDVASDSYKPTTDRELAPLFKAIFRGAPTSNQNDAVLDYLTEWHGVLSQVYPDYRPTGEGNLAGGALAVDQAFIFQMLLPAFETVGVDLDIRGVAHALGITETRIVTHAAGATLVDGTNATDYFYMTRGNQTLRGGAGADFYFVGRDSGDDVIDDKDAGDADQLRFTDVLSGDVKAIRDGEDLILQIRGRSNAIRLTDQFLGELNDLLSNGKRVDSGVGSIVFADGVVWDRFRMSVEVVDKERAAGLFNDALVGSGSADILWGGRGNDYMSGGAGGDFYVFQRGDGQDVIDDLGAFSFGPVKAGIDILNFRGGITADNLRLIRDGESESLKIVVLDDDGNATGDTLELIGQFGGVRLGLGLFAEALNSSDGLDYVAPNLIERFIFDDGASLSFGEIVQKVLENAKTAGDDAIFGVLNANTLDGGAGDDFLSGKQGDDTYIFGRGYGRDVVLDNAIPGLFEPPQHDKLQFIDEIRWTDLDFLRDGPSDTLRMRVKGATDEVILQDFLDTVPILGFVNLIEDIVFGDGTTWTAYKLAQHYIDIAKTAGNDTIYGYDELSDSIDGGVGDDRLIA